MRRIGFYALVGFLVMVALVIAGAVQVGVILLLQRILHVTDSTLIFALGYGAFLLTARALPRVVSRVEVWLRR